MKIVTPFIHLFELYNGMLLAPAGEDERIEPTVPAEPFALEVEEIQPPALTLAANG